MHSGKGGKVVTDPDQAKAVSLSVCGKSKYSEMLQGLGYSEDTATIIEKLFSESLVKTSKKSASSPSV
jgi:hypothetical protein